MNCLNLTAVPFLHKSSTCKADDSLSKADKVPWIGTCVIITKIGSPHKGYIGVIKDVLCGQDTASGLKISIQLMHLDPSSPFRTVIFDHDDVVEQRYKSNIFTYDARYLMPLLQGLDICYWTMKSPGVCFSSLQKLI